jgi:hypothetical protein
MGKKYRKHIEDDFDLDEYNEQIIKTKRDNEHEAKVFSKYSLIIALIAFVTIVSFYFLINALINYFLIY